MIAVKKLMRDVGSKEWLTAKGDFSMNIDDAMEIENFSHASRMCRMHKERRLELVMKFPNDADDVFLPMD